MRISLEETRKVAKLYQSEHKSQAAPVSEQSEHIPAVTHDPSKDAILLEQLVQEVRNMPEVRQDRIEDVQAKIRTGKAQVSGKEIADSILRRILADRLR